MEPIGFGGSKHLYFHDFLRDFLTKRSIGPMRDEDTPKRFRNVMERVSQRFFNKSFTTL